MTMAIESLVVDDEPLARDLLAGYVKQTPFLHFAGACSSAVEALTVLQREKIDLIFLDIQMPQLNGLELSRMIGTQTRVVFTTAFEQYALEGFRVDALDYLLKPIGPEELRQALDKLTSLQRQAPADDRFEDLIRTLQNRARYKTHFLIPGKGDKLLPLSVEQVQYFYIAEGIVRAVLSTTESMILPFTLDELSERLDPDLFFRINRQHLISRGAIQDIDLWFNNRLAVNLKIPTGEKIVVSRLRVNEFKTWFSGR